jgi:hypothetical protein
VAYRAEPICNGIYNAQFGGLISGCYLPPPSSFSTACMTGSLKFFSEPNAAKPPVELRKRSTGRRSDGAGLLGRGLTKGPSHLCPQSEAISR